MPAKTQKIAPVHPGTILKEEFLKPMGLSQNKLALALHVDTPRVNKIVQGERAVTADTALRLAEYFDISPEFWMNLQARYDLEVAKDEKANRIAKEVRVGV